jgi:hypothetical protein
MYLSAEQFIETVKSLTNGEPKDGLAIDQRRQPRAGIQSVATIIPLSETAHPSAISIQVRDLSPAGIGFLHEHKMSLDEQFALVLPRQGDTPSVILCSVAFWQPLQKNLFAMGARFRRVLRDGGEVGLPIEIQNTFADLAETQLQFRRKAG